MEEKKQNKRVYNNLVIQDKLALIFMNVMLLSFIHVYQPSTIYILQNSSNPFALLSRR